MASFLCALWPYLAGALGAWLLSGLLKRPQIEVEKIVERKVEIDNPAHIAKIAELEARTPDTVEKIVEVEKVVEVDNPALVAKIAELEARAPQTVEKIVEKTVEVDNPAHLSRISALEARLKAFELGPTIDLAAARAAGFEIMGPDDLKIIEGIGPKIEELLNEDGVKTFMELSRAEIPRLQRVLDAAGPNFKLADPGTWPEQAMLAAYNRWKALKILQDVLDGGVRR